MPDRLMTVKEVAEYLQVNERTILELASEGAFPASRVGNLGLEYQRAHPGWASKLSWMLTRPEYIRAVLETPDQPSIRDPLSRAESGPQFPRTVSPEVPDSPQWSAA